MATALDTTFFTPFSGKDQHLHQCGILMIPVFAIPTTQFFVPGSARFITLRKGMKLFRWIFEQHSGKRVFQTVTVNEQIWGVVSEVAPFTEVKIYSTGIVRPVSSFEDVNGAEGGGIQIQIRNVDVENHMTFELASPADHESRVAHLGLRGGEVMRAAHRQWRSEQVEAGNLETIDASSQRDRHGFKFDVAYCDATETGTQSNEDSSCCIA